MRDIAIKTHVVPNADGSALISFGNTQVLCTASKIESVPSFKKGSGTGWLTAEYVMLPASTHTRRPRETLKPDGRSVEIRRLIGRALRACIDLDKLPEWTVYLDCDVINADGGTRTASITGAYVALALAVRKWTEEGLLSEHPLTHAVAALSVGLKDSRVIVDLDYAADSTADVDMNVVMLDSGAYVEVQGTGEGAAFGDDELADMLAGAKEGMKTLFEAQCAALMRRGLVLATNNAGKVREFKMMLAPYYEPILSLRDAGIEVDVEENGDTFEQNALKKAQAIAAFTQYDVLADDSGLCVDALGGAPGVYSARYAGAHGDDEANIDKLLAELSGVECRDARFVAALALARHGAAPIISRGECPGIITRERRGGGGFGYDPVFEYAGGLTFGQMDAEAKNAISHRSRALDALVNAVATRRG